MSHSINGNGGIQGIQPSGHTEGTQQTGSSEGKLQGWSVAATQGNVIVGDQPAPERTSHKVLSERHIEVLHNYDNFLLKRGAGGSDKNAQQAKELREEAKDLFKQVKKYSTATEEVKEAAQHLRSLRSKLGSKAIPTVRNGLRSAEKKLIDAESKMHREAAKLASDQDMFDINIGTAKNNKSALKGLYDPPKPGFFHKDDRPVLQLQLEGLKGLEQDLRTSLESALLEARSGDKAAGLEVHRLNQQIQELGESKSALEHRLHSSKGFHRDDAPSTPLSENAMTSMQLVQADLNLALSKLRNARKNLDTQILSGSAQTGKEARKTAEDKLRTAEKTVEKQAIRLKGAGKEYSNALKSDRWNAKANRKAQAKRDALIGYTPQRRSGRKKNQPQATNTQTVSQATSQKPQQPAAQPARAQSKPQPQTRPAQQQPVAQKAPTKPVYPTSMPTTEEDIKAAKAALAGGHQSRTLQAEVLGLANKVLKMKDKYDVAQMKVTVMKHERLSMEEKRSLRLLMNTRIMDLMKTTSFAENVKHDFVDHYVIGQHYRQLIDETRIDTLSDSSRKKK